MRDLFEILEPNNPVESARRGARPALRQRFFERVTVEPAEGGFAVMLDGKPVRTPARRFLSAPHEALAQAIATEWDAQRDVIDPARMPLTRLANAIIDGVADAPIPVTAEIEKYLSSDLLFYRTTAPDQLCDREAQQWDPILAWARESLGADFKLGEGIVHVSQPQAALEAAATAIPRDPWRLGAVSVVTTLTGSALIALAMLRGVISADAAWQAAHVDEDWNMEKWGRDDMALERRAFRFAELQAAATILEILNRP
jgi:chaperone required for assembly of F1-ATPase